VIASALREVRLLVRGIRILTAAALATAVMATAANSAGAAPGRTDPRPKGGEADPAAAVMVRGTVLDYRTRQGCIGRSVVIGGEQTTTDVDGRFAIAAPPGVYDLAIVEPNRSSATFYRGLRRRDLLLLHSIDPNLVPKGYDKHVAHIDGKLSGGGFDPGSSNMTRIYFLSPQVRRDRTLAGQTHDARGAAYGPLTLAWIGPESIAGDVVAVRTTRDKPDAGAPARDGTGSVVWWEAHEKVKVVSGEVAMADLAFARLPMGHIAGQIDVAPGLSVTGRSVHYLVLPNAGIPIDGDGAERRPGPFDFPVPDLRHMPGQYCASAYDGARGIHSFTSKCGLAFGATDVTLKLRAPPKLTTLKERTQQVQTISRDTQFGWTAFEGGIHQLTLHCGGDPENPNVFVYTTATRTPWPDLRAVDVAFPKVGQMCHVSVTGLGPYQGMDEAFSPEGIGSTFPKETYGGRSTEPYVIIAPPGKPAAGKPPRKILHDEASPR